MKTILSWSARRYVQPLRSGANRCLSVERRIEAVWAFEVKNGIKQTAAALSLDFTRSLSPSLPMDSTKGGRVSLR